jgi:gamma-tubulin complex component 6
VFDCCNYFQIFHIALKAMDFIYLNYKVDWPMNIIITDDHIYKYNQVLHFILQIKRASWILKKSFIILKQKLTSCTDVHMRFIYTQRQQLQHFVTVLECYIANQIFHLSWCELEHTLDQASNLDDLIKCHNDYLNTLLFRCLLNQKLQPILNIIDNCLGAVIKFGGHLLYQRAQPQTLHVIYNSFRDSSALLYKVIYKLVQKSYQPHLEEFLLCLDFNNFYSNYSSSRYR